MSAADPMGPSIPTPVEGRIGHRLSIGMVDQAMSGSTNVMIAVVAARELSPRDFGVFGIVTLVYLLTVSAIRALVNEPMLVHPPGRVPGGQLRAGLLLAGGAGAVTVSAGLVAGGTARTPLLALAALLPLLVLQDVGRYLAFARRTPIGALRVDVMWFVLQVLGIAGLYVAGGFTVTRLVLAWGGAGAIAGAWVVLTQREGGMVPSAAWVREAWDLSWRYLISFGTTYGIAYAAALGLGAVSGAEAVGALRGAQLVLSPLTMLFAAAINILVAEISGRQISGHDLRDRMRKVSLAMTGAAAALTAVGLLLPDAIGRIALGDSWPAAHRLLLPAGAQILLIGAWAGAKIGMTGMRAVREALRLDLTAAPILFVLPISGAIVGDAEGFLWALVAAHAVIFAIWWRAFARITADRQRVLDADA
jgi:hypothetical protein